MKSVLHIINSLEVGGAETFLSRLILNDKSNKHIVVCLIKNNSKLYKILKKNNILIYNLNFNNVFNSIYFSLKLLKIIYQINPDLIQTWLYHSDLIGGVIGKVFFRKKIIWSIRTSLENSEDYKLTTRLICKLNSKLSHWIPSSIIFCSNRIFHEHINIGFKKEISSVIQNGVDMNVFFRKQLNERDYLKKYFPNNVTRFAIIANFVPQKDHFSLIRAIERLSKKQYKFKVLLIGRMENDFNFNYKFLLDYIHESKVHNLVDFYGFSSDIPNILRNIDFLILSSKSEGFPNVLIEAMASGVPCISTNVGDAAEIVGLSGWICPPQNHIALSNCIEKALKVDSYEYDALSRKCVERVKNNYDIKKMVKKYSDIY